MADHNKRIYESIIGLLSSADNPTPLVRLNRITPFKHTVVYGKLEWYNPFGAVKDRVAANMIRDAEETGNLGEGRKLVEATSGNTGLGLAMVGNARGYPLRTPLSSAIPVEKRTMLRFFGSDVVELNDSLCPAPGAPEGAIAKAHKVASENEEFILLNQYANEANPDSHYRTTGPEIWKQTDARVTHFVASLGTCGTITGTGRFLKEQNDKIKVIGVHPEDGHDIPGVRSLVQLQHTQLFRPEEYDKTIEVSNRDAYDMCLRLNREESIIGGPSAGLALCGAFKLIPDEPGNIAVVIFPDDVFKYASSFQRHFPYLFPTEKNDTEQQENAFLTSMLENLKNPHDSVKVDDLKKELAGEKRPLVVDIRRTDIFDESHIDGSINIPMETIYDKSANLPDDRDAEIVMVCGIGKFSKNTVLFLKSMGYRHVKSVKGGVNEWLRKGHPLTTTAK